MIRVDRGREPAVLARNEARWRQALLRARTPRGRERIQRRYQHRTIKQALVAAFHGKCAYCESFIRHAEYGHIEHFRPRSKYPDLIFSWVNLLLACGVCNGREYKGEEFPLEAEGGLLIDPCSEEPAEHLVFEYDEGARLASVRGRTERGQLTVELLGLNRKDLRTYRSKQVTRLWVIALQARHDPEARRLLEEAALSSGEYSAFAAALKASLADKPRTRLSGSRRSRGVTAKRARRKSEPR